ncbi:MAG: sugar phosphate isomerase/epimerase [Acidobacteria bacterium]|nr:sugar phosphate isomerase/epimerase [Acidobacteriota bacterium]
MNRRTFLTAAAAAPLAASPASKRPTLCIFSKHMAQFGYDQLGKEAKRIGFEGIDLTVRAKGHVLPERAGEDLPRAVEAIRGHGLSVPMITTELVRPADPTARPILSAAGRLKIPYWKLGYWKYDLNNVEKSLADTKRAVTGLVALSREYGLEAGFHNHSGAYVGATIWDTREIIAGMDPRSVGYYFDPGHATIEGGLAGWRLSQKIALQRLKMVALKDFYWAKDGQGRWRPKWCPLGEGMVDWENVLAGFAAAGFQGPLSLHVEYETKDELAAIARDFEFMKKATAAAYR